jgi:hypothetical protein
MELSRRGVLRAGGGVVAGSGFGLGGLGVAGRARADAPQTTPDGYATLGSVPVEGLKETVVGPDGRYVFCATTTGFAVVDAAEPSAPAVVVERRDLLEERENGPLRQIWDVAVEDDRLVLGGPAHPTHDLRAVVAYDVADPTAPERLGVRETDVYHHNLFVENGRVYLTGNGRPGSPVIVLDGDLRELGQWSLADADEAWLDVPSSLNPLHDLRVQDGLAYLAYWDAGTWIVDVSDPSAPTAVAKVRGRPPGAFTDLDGPAVSREATELPGNDHYATVDETGSLLGIGSEAWDGTPENGAVGGPGGIELFDISEPARPRSLATVAPPPTPDASLGGTWTTAHNFELVGERLYAAWYRGGVRVFDVAEPARPRLLRAWRDSARASFWTAQVLDPGRAFVAASRRNPDAGPGTGRLYVFPDAPPGASGEPATTRTDVVTTRTDGNHANATNTTDATTETTATSTTTTAATTTGTGPGFGVVTALGALGLGAWRALAGEESEDGEQM